MNINDLIESLVRTYSLPALKGHVTPYLAKEKTLESGEEGVLSLLKEEGFLQDELERISNNLFSTSHFHCYLYETDTEIDFIKLKNTHNNLPTDWDAHKTIIEDDCFDGFLEIDISIQEFDLSQGKYVGDKYPKKCYIPFRVKEFSKKHIGVMFSKFEIREFTNGTSLSRVLDNPYDPYSLAVSAVEYWMDQNLLPSAVSCDLTKGLRKLVSEDKINSLNVTIEFDGGSLENRKEGKKKTNYKFVPKTWHDQYLFSADRIMKSKWYWYSGATIKSIRGLPSISIDPAIGLVSQDAFVSESQEYLINELLAANS